MTPAATACRPHPAGSEGSPDLQRVVEGGTAPPHSNEMGSAMSWSPSDLSGNILRFSERRVS